MAALHTADAVGVEADAGAGRTLRGRLLPRRLLAGALVGFVSVLAVGGSYAQMVAHEMRPLSLGGVPLPASGDPEGFIRELGQLWYETEVTIDAGAQTVRISRRELGGRVDQAAAVRWARDARGLSPLHRRSMTFASAVYASAFADGPPVGAAEDHPWRVRVDREATHAELSELRARLSVDPEPATFAGRGGRPGTAIAHVASTTAVVHGLERGALLVTLPVRRVAPPLPRLLNRREARYDEVVSAHETHYRGSARVSGRAQNIELAARLLDGHVIEPNAEISFNEVVGERTFGRGFAPATELAGGGRRTEGIGGGICQVAATLYAAAFLGGFEVLEQHPHTRNSSYIPVGLDTAVSWPNKDLRLRNPYSHHVRVRATAYRGTLRVELMGARRGPRVEWNTRVVSRVRRGIQRERRASLPADAELVEDEGEDGSVVEITRTVHAPDGAVTEQRTLRYPAVDRLVVSGRGRAAAPPAAAPSPTAE